MESTGLYTTAKAFIGQTQTHKAARFVGKMLNIKMCPVILEGATFIFIFLT